MNNIFCYQLSHTDYLLVVFNIYNYTQSIFHIKDTKLCHKSLGAITFPKNLAHVLCEPNQSSLDKLQTKYMPNLLYTSFFTSLRSSCYCFHKFLSFYMDCSPNCFFDALQGQLQGILLPINAFKF